MRHTVGKDEVPSPQRTSQEFSAAFNDLTTHAHIQSLTSARPKPYLLFRAKHGSLPQKFQSFQAQSEAQCARFVSAFTSKHSALATRWDALEADWKELRARMAAVQKGHCEEVDHDELVRLNVGGKPMDIRRSTLTICQGSRLEALFSGRWEKALRREASGRIFIDDNAKCFQKLLTSLQRLKDSPADQVKQRPQMEGDQQHYFETMLENYGVNHALGYPAIMKAHSSSLLYDRTHRVNLASWLDNPSSLQLLYRGTRDGWRAEDFHRLCNNQGETLTVIKFPSGCLFGGYADQPWQRREALVASSKAFLFTLTGPQGVSRMNISPNS